jgi:hypothetical protein
MRHFETYNNAGWYLWYEILNGKGTLIVVISKDYWSTPITLTSVQEQVEQQRLNKGQEKQ